MQAQFIPSPRGQLFTLYFATTQPPRGCVLCLAPFCEEMNRTRALMSQQARRFAAQGYACLMFDYFGTGDSAGILADASWSGWQDDAHIAADWLERETGLKPILWGIRLGALLAAELHYKAPQRFHHLLLWHPVSDGKTYITQILRLRIAALSARNQATETTGEMRAKLHEGQTVEVSGYEIPGALACRIDALSLTGLSLQQARLDWLEPVASGQPDLPGGVTRTVAQLQAAGCRVATHPVSAPAVWLMSGPADGSAFIDTSLNCLASAGLAL